MCASNWFRTIAAFGLVFCGAIEAHANYLTTDGDFGNQTNGVTLTSPWNDPIRGAVGSTASQSSFTNVFANNSMGVYSGQDTLNYFGQSFTPIAANATGVRYLNVDFQCVSSAAGHYGITLSDDNYGNGKTLSLLVSSSGVYAQSGSGVGSVILVPEVGVWYNAQLALNFDTDTYSGMITREGTFAQTAISTRSFIGNLSVTRVFEDPANFADALLPGQDANSLARIDNLVFSPSALPAPTPEPSTLLLLGTGLAGLLAYAWRKRK